MIDPFKRSENQNKLPRRSLADPIRHHRINSQYDKKLIYTKGMIGN